MEEFQDKKQKTGFMQANYFGILAVAIILSFVVGNRWESIVERFDAQESAQSVEITTGEGLPEDLDYSSVEQLYDVLKENFDGDLSQAALLDGLKKGLADASGDQYTVYLTKEEAEQFDSDLNGTFSGIGAELGLDDNDRLIIVAPLSGFPAEAAGLRAQDIVAEIDGEDSVNISVEEAVTRIRGEEGTDVTLTVVRGGEAIEITVTRQNIVVPSVETELLSDGKVGYMKVSRFAEDTTALARAAAEEFVESGVESVILDVRNDSGGYLQAAVDVAGLWVEDQVVVDQRQGDQSTGALKTGNNAPLKGIPTVVLTNAGSASASEIVAGALQDLDAAQLVGTKTFGKGSVQSLERLRDGGVLKVTIARWYTPNGQNIDEDGIKPDVEVQISDEDFAADRDPQLDSAIELLTQ